MNPEPFDGMTDEEFKLLAQEAMNIQSQAHLKVLSGMIVVLLQRSGMTSMDGLSAEAYIERATVQTVRVLLPTMADHLPGRAAQLSAFLESMDIYKNNPPKPPLA